MQGIEDTPSEAPPPKKSWPKHFHSRKNSSPNTLHNEKNDVSLSKELKKQAGTQSTEGPQEPSHGGRCLNSHLSDDAVPTRRLSHYLFLETSFPLRWNTNSHIKDEQWMLNGNEPDSNSISQHECHSKTQYNYPQALTYCGSTWKFYALSHSVQQTSVVLINIYLCF